MRSLNRSQPRIDWQAERERIDLADVATRLLGPPPGRNGEHGRRLWWVCPFHDDKNPSLCVEPGKPWWKCFGCGEKGDAVTLVMKRNGMTFLEAVASLTGSPVRSQVMTNSPRQEHAPRPAPKVDDDRRPTTLSLKAASKLVEFTAGQFLGTNPDPPFKYLNGFRRGLNLETVRKARLGVTAPIGLPGKPRGIVIPWFNGDALTMVKIRQPSDRTPKYYEAFRDKERHLGIYPGRHVIRPGRPLIVTEGEFDALLLSQLLGDLVAVVTLGSASARPDTDIYAAMLTACPWYIATDGDAAGDKAAEGWPDRARRIRPPEPYKDWTDAYRGGVDLVRWWGDVISRIEPVLACTLDELVRLRWGPGLVDQTPGIIIP